MSLKPISPKNPRAKRVARPVAAPVVVVRKKESGAGGLIVVILLILALGGGYYAYSTHQQKEEALAARQHQLEENARRVAEAERQRAEHERGRHQQEDNSNVTALGTAIPSSSAPAPVETDTNDDEDYDEPEEAAEESGTNSVLGSTSAPTAGDGVFSAEDTSPAPFDLTAQGNASKKVIDKLAKAIDEASKSNTFHDLQADLKRSFEKAQPTLFADASTLPPFPDKEERLQRLAQGIYVCLNLAAELDARNTVPAEQHAKFVNWLLKEKAKAARTFVYGLEHYSITDVTTATDLLDELRQAYLVSPSSGMKKIKPILEKGAKN